MFKLVVLLSLIAIAAARPGLYGHVAAPLVYAEPAVASGYEYSASVHAPDYVNHVSVSAPLLAHGHYAYPKAISHQTSTIVHGKPTLLATPIIAPAVHSYHAPLVHGW